MTNQELFVLFLVGIIVICCWRELPRYIRQYGGAPKINVKEEIERELSSKDKALLQSGTEFMRKALFAECMDNDNSDDKINTAIKEFGLVPGKDREESCHRLVNNFVKETMTRNL